MVMTELIYLGVAIGALLLMPLIIYFYLQKRWYVASSVERTFMYFLMFISFPGMLLFSPFLNFRPRPRSIED